MARHRLIKQIPKEELDWQVGELSLYIDNDYPIYQRKMNWFKTMWKKFQKGEFDAVKAETGFAYLTAEAAKKYNGQGFGAEYKIGTTARKVVNRELVSEFLAAAKNKEYDFMR